MSDHFNAMDVGVQPDQAHYRADVFEDGSVAIIRDTEATKMAVIDERGAKVVESMELTRQHHDELAGLNMVIGKDVQFDLNTKQFFQRDIPGPNGSGVEPIKFK